MPHETHQMNAYRDLGLHTWISYCKKCSAETDADLQLPCPGEYIRKDTTKTVDKIDDAK